MPRGFELERISDEEARRRIRRELDLELLQTRALLKTIDVIEAMSTTLGFAHTGNLRDGTLVFESDGAQFFIRRDWAYAGVRYAVCCWSAEGRPCRRVATLRRLVGAVRALRFRTEAWRRLEIDKALVPSTTGSEGMLPSPIGRRVAVACVWGCDFIAIYYVLIDEFT